MSINDINEELNSIDTNKDIVKEENKSVECILNDGIKLIEDFVGTKIVNMYSRPWSKLEPKLK